MRKSDHCQCLAGTLSRHRRCSSSERWRCNGTSRTRNGCVRGGATWQNRTWREQSVIVCWVRAHYWQWLRLHSQKLSTTPQRLFRPYSHSVALPSRTRINISPLFLASILVLCYNLGPSSLPSMVALRCSPPCRDPTSDTILYNPLPSVVSCPIQPHAHPFYSCRSTFDGCLPTGV